MRHRRRPLGMLGATVVTSLVATLVLAACTSSGGNQSAQAGAAQGKAPINIAIVNDLSGTTNVVALGAGVQAGFETALAEVNKAGGISGRKLAVTAYDGQTDPSTASAAIRQAISTNPQAILGFLASYEFTPSLAVVNAAKVPWIEASTVFSGLNTPYFYALLPSPQTSALALVAATKRLLGGSLQGKRIAIEGNSPSSFMDPSIVTFTRAAEQEGAQAVLTIRDPQDLSSWTSQAANVMSAKADAVVIFHVNAAAVVIGKALKVAGYRGVVLADFTAAADSTLSAVDLSNFNELKVGPSIKPDSDIATAIRAAHASLTSAEAEPTYFAAGYAAVWVLARTLEKCGVSCTGAKFVSTVKGLGPISVPINPFYGPPDFSSEQSGTNTFQIVKLDMTTQQPLPVGPVINGG